MARSRKTKSLVLSPQPDPKAPLDPSQFLSVAQGVLNQLTTDLLARADESPAITAGLKARHAHDKQQGLTADGYPVWRRGVIVQIAAAWLLSCVFVRTLEDRGLLARNRLAGPGALDSERAFAKLAPHLGLREYLLTLFTELEHLPAARRLFDREHNLAWRLAPSPEGAKALVDLFRSGDPEMPHFRFGQPSTRFLGDLYQDLSEEVRKRYALLQTPEFVEEFILDRTLEPAIAEFGLPATTIIDPTCGSGHFLLGAFERLFNHWCEAEPGEPNAIHVAKALRAVHGVDINPYAVSIAQFRLTLAAIDKLGVERLRDCPELPLNVVVADSLLHNYVQGQAGFADLLGQDASAWYGEEWKLEDGDAAKRTLGRGFAAVVGNPPYITVKDKALRDKYRAMYKAATGGYALSAPFAERFFQLAAEGGFVGQITANSFMKREFGKALVTEVLPTVDLTSIINTSGAYIPGHGTPTVILFGRNQAPVGDKVDAVLARRGEPSTPADPAQGLVWSSIRDHADEDGYEDEYVTVTRVPREKLAVHPWSLEGGGAGELKSLLEERASSTLADLVRVIGRTNVVGEDDVWLRPSHSWVRAGGKEWLVPFTTGETVRDWSISGYEFALYPYDKLGNAEPTERAEVQPLLWPWRTLLANRTVFGKRISESKRKWWEHLEHYNDRLRDPLSIAFPFVSTHNHFVLDRGGKLFNRTAPIIKLPADATEDDHLALLAYLNSSTACFWMKQVFQPKGSATRDTITPESDRYEFTGTGLGQLPIPHQRARLVGLARAADSIAQARSKLDPSAIVGDESRWSDYESLRELLTNAEAEESALERKLVYVQEEIDWAVYSLCGLSTLPGGPSEGAIEPDARPFAWHDAHAPVSVPAQLGLLYEARRKLIEEDSRIRLIETPGMKRLWRGTSGESGRYGESYEDRVRRAAHGWLAQRLEDELAQRQQVVGLSALVAGLRNDQRVQAAASTYAGQREPDLRNVLAQILSDDAVAHHPALIYTDSGLTKHAMWKEVWALQRREDAGEKVDIPVPPAYSQGSRGKATDFLKTEYWRLRGKLDVPKERFISYPLCESDENPQPLYGWAGWDHAQRAEALLTLYNQRRQEEAWPAERLIPMLAGVLELLPWLKQWHNEPDEETGERLGDAYDSWLSEELRELGLTRDELEAWRPPSKARRGRKKSSAAKRTSTKSGKKSGGKKKSADLTAD